MFGDAFVVLVFDDAVDVSPTPDGTALRVLHVASTGPASTAVAVDFAGQARQRYGAADGEAIVVRPDGYVMARRPRFDRDDAGGAAGADT